MFKRRNGVLAFLMAAVLLLGVGYAALTDTLTVAGSAAAQISGENGASAAFDEDVYFSTATPAVESVSATIDSTKDKITITVPAGVLKLKDETTVINATIKNDSKDHAAKVTLQNTSTDNFSVDCAWAGEANGTIVAGESADLTITIKLNTAPTADISAEEFTVSFDVTTDVG